MVKNIVKGFLSSFWIAWCAHAASPFAGFYTGQIYVTISGNVSVPERPIGGTALTVNESGGISSLSDLNGSVTDAGVITWSANSTGFTTGKLENGVISSSTTVNNNGTVSTFRIQATNTGPGIGEKNLLANRFSQLNPTQALRDMNRVRFTEDRFLAVGRSGAFAVSYDGINWTRTGVPTVLALYDVAYGNGHYVVVGDSGARFWSTNGVDWVANPAGPGPVAAVAFGNGKFAMATFNGAIFVSTDGVAWSSSAPLGGAGYSGLDFVNGEFAAWSGDQIAFSADASDWATKKGSPGIGNITVSLAIHTKIAQGNGVYVLAGQQGLAFSANGTSWTKASKASGVLFGNSASVTFGNGIFVVCDTADDLWTSTDGQQWTRVDQIELHSIAYGNGRFVGVGDTAWSSTDGVVWVLPQQDQARADNREPSFVDPYSESAIVNRFLEGSTGTYSFGRAGTIRWYKHQFDGGSGSAPQLTSETLRCAMNIRYGEPPVIAGNRGALIVAEDRQTVTFKLIPAVTSADLLHGAKGADTLVFVGTGGAIIYTKDWIQRTNWAAANSGTVETLKHAAWYAQDKTGQPGVWIVTGERGSLLTSPDGVAWTRRESTLTTDLVGSAYDRDVKRFLVAGADGTLLQSTNGVIWSRTLPLPVSGTLRYFNNTDPNFGSYGITGGGDKGLIVTLVPAASQIPQAGRFTMGSPPAFYYSRLNALTLGNGRWVAAGANLSSISPDGEHWTSHTNDFEALGVAFGHGKFVAVGSGRIIGLSGDGLRWTLRTNVLARDFRTIVFGGGRFVAAGANGAVGLSEDGITWTDKSTPNSSVTYNDITWSNGTFIAAGTSGTVLISTNLGASWLEKPTFVPEIKGITFGNGNFVVVAANGFSAISTNGLNWQSKQYPYISPVEDRPIFSEIAFNAGTFYAPSTRGEIYTSTDGLNWKRNFTGVGLELKGAVVANGAIMFVADNEIHRLSIPDGGSPIVTQSPSAATVNEDGTVTLTGAFLGSDLQYTWLKDGAPIEGGPRFSGADSTQLTISPFLQTDAGRYELVAANPFGSKSSAGAVVTVNPKAFIATQPRSSVEAVGTKVTLSVEATGQSLGYQWFRNGTAIAGATAAQLEIPQLSADDAGDYYVEVTNPVGARASQHAAVSVVSVPAGYQIDPTWPNPGVVANYLYPSAFQPDGKLILYGAITVNGVTKNLARLNVDGTVDTTFTGDTPDNQVRAIHVLADGKILIGGFFRTVGGQARMTLARLNADGKVDPTYNAGITQLAAVYVFQPRADGKIWIGGSFTQLGGLNNVRYLGLLNADGTPDPAYTPPILKDYILAIYPNADGSLLLGGGNVSSRGMLTKILANGTIDNTFPSGGNGPGALGGAFSSPNVQVIAPGPNGKYYIGGAFNYYNGQPSMLMARIQANGELDTTFTSGMGKNTSANVRTLTPLGDKILIGGEFYAYGGNTNAQYLALASETGAHVATPNFPKITGTVLNVYLRENNSLVVLATFPGADGKSTKSLARFVEAGGAELSLGIVRQPQSTTLQAGLPATLAVAATGKGTLTFQWSKNGEVLPGEIRPTLVIAAAAPENAGTYAVEVKDSGGAVTSQNAILSFGELPSSDGFAAWATSFSLPAGKNRLQDDADGDGSSNAAEYAFGTNPMQAGSQPQLEPKSVAAAGQSYPAVSYVRNKNATGVAIQVRASNSVTFDTATPTVEVTPAEDLGNGLERITVRSATAAPHTFFFEVKTAGN